MHTNLLYNSLTFIAGSCGLCVQLRGTFVQLTNKYIAGSCGLCVQLRGTIYPSLILPGVSKPSHSLSSPTTQLNITLCQTIQVPVSHTIIWSS